MNLKTGTMLLDDISKKLLGEVFKENINNPTGVDSKKFRANHEEHLDLLSELESNGYLKVKDSVYNLSLIALAELEKDFDEIVSLLDKCDQLYKLLRLHYKNFQETPFTLNELSEHAGLPRRDINTLLVYIIGIHVWSNYNDVNKKDAHITPSENILRYKSFRDYLKKLIKQKRKALRKENSKDLNTKIPLYKCETSYNHSQFISKPEWYSLLDPAITRMMDEIHYALEKEMSALPSMGLRSIIDMVCNELIGDVGGFEKKLKTLVEEGYITERNKKILKNALDVGHASTHRGYFPDFDTLCIVLKIIEHLLDEVYVLAEESKRLKEITPKRKRPIT